MLSNHKKRENEKGEPDDAVLKDTVDENESKKPKLEKASVKKHMPLKNLSQRATSSFKSPLMSRKPKDVNENIETIVNTLEDKMRKVEEEIMDLQGENYSVDELDSIIKKLHDYNEIKDIAQLLMGKIADIKCVTVKEIHKDFNAHDIDE